MTIQAKSTKEARELLKKEEGLNELSQYCEKIFEILDKIHFKLKAREIVDPEEVDEAIDKVTGYRGFLNPLLEAFEAEMDNSENAYYINRKEQIEKEGTKFTSAPVEREASLSVANLRTIRNQLRGYVNQADIDINVLQSKLKYYTERAKLEK